MIGSPQSDFTHTFHVGVSGETFGDVTSLTGAEKSSPVTSQGPRVDDELHAQRSTIPSSPSQSVGYDVFAFIPMPFFLSSNPQGRTSVDAAR